MNPIQLVFALLFWVCCLFVVYTYLGYPLAIWCLSRWFGRPVRPPVIDEFELPAVSLLIAAYNEEAEIEKRIESALQMDYPKDKLEIVVASDGSTDATAALVRRFADRNVRLLDYPQRRGKAAVINAAFAEVKGAIIMLSDANTHTESSAVRKIVRWFRDPRVGVVCGKLRLMDARNGRNVDGLYWKYETFLKQCEGHLGALLGANGAIYTIRRDLFTPIPNDTIVDDFVIPLQAKLRSDCRLIYDSEAVASEETAPDVTAEFHRRSRIGAGGFQSIAMLWKLLNPLRGWIAFSFFSHKILRWFCPFFLLGMLFSNLVLLDHPLYRLCLVGQFAFYMLACGSAFLPCRTGTLKLLRLTTMFTSMNLALLVGFWRWLSGSQKGVWKRTARLAEEGVMG